MNILIYDTPEADPDKTLLLHLRKRDNTVIVCVVDKDGIAVPGGSLASFYPDGTMCRHGFVNRHLGLTYDTNGRIKERNFK